MVGNTTLNSQGLYIFNKSKSQNGVNFKMGKVNLDALIPRADFEFKEDSVQDTTENTDKIKLSDLERKGNFFYPALRKPDFQRETNEWNPNKIKGLIESFVNQDLIPAIIMWNTKGSFTFAIDGAHRLSALIAWVNDDYGDGVISRTFFESISDEQKKIADKTRKLIEFGNKIHSYKYYKDALDNPKGIDETIVQKARDLSRHTLQLQWVKGGSKKAEDSFFRINQEAVKISPAELELSKAREKPNGISARAIKNRGMGYKYWSKFTSDIQSEIEKLSKEIYDLIFIPPLKQPIKSIDLLPLAGKSDSAYSLPLVLNFVNIVNKLMDKNISDIQNDDEGKITLEYLQRCKKIALKFNSIDTSSLGLHPAIYLYSSDGNYKIVSFYSTIALLLDFENNPELQKQFTGVRKDFEKILLRYDDYISQLVRRYRAGKKGYNHIKDFYLEIIKKLSQKETKASLMKELKEREEEKTSKKPKEFSISAKSAVVIKTSLKNALTCKICGGLIDPKPRTIDHKQRKQDDGLGVIDNGQIAHPYCNSTYKN